MKNGSKKQFKILSDAYKSLEVEWGDELELIGMQVKMERMK